jgi:hypothetical protein
MWAYFDTSTLVKRYIDESGRREVLQLDPEPRVSFIIYLAATPHPTANLALQKIDEWPPIQRAAVSLTGYAQITNVTTFWPLPKSRSNTCVLPPCVVFINCPHSEGESGGFPCAPCAAAPTVVVESKCS